MTETDNATLETVRRIEDHLAGLDRDMETDRQNLQNLNIKVEQLVGEVGELRRSVTILRRKVRDDVAEAIEPAIVANEELKKEVNKAKKKSLVFITEKKNWFSKLFERK